MTWYKWNIHEKSIIEFTSHCGLVQTRFSWPQYPGTGNSDFRKFQNRFSKRFSRIYYALCSLRQSRFWTRFETFALFIGNMQCLYASGRRATAKWCGTRYFIEQHNAIDVYVSCRVRFINLCNNYLWLVTNGRT